MMVTFSASALFVLLTVNISTGSIVQPPVQVFLSSKEGRERLAQQENVSWVPASAFTSSSFKVQVKVTPTKQNLEGFGGKLIEQSRIQLPLFTVLSMTLGKRMLLKLSTETAAIV
jgi:hypothetical protein